MTKKIFIAMYKPHDGQEEALRQLIEQHLPTLKRLGLITDRPGILAKAADGTYLEIAEWCDEQAAGKAHRAPEVGKIWQAMSEICDFPGLADLPEANKPFPNFTAIEK